MNERTDPPATRPRGPLGIVTSPGIRLVVLALLVGLAGVVAFRAEGTGLAALREAVDSLGPGGPVVFAVVYAAAVTVMLPASPFTVAAGVVFGPLVGTMTALVGATVGATGAFAVGRVIGRSAVEQVGGRQVAALDRYLARRGFASLLVVRLVPLFPFNLVNLTAGVTGLAWRDYVLATAAGIIPGTFAYAALGGTIDDPTSPAFLLALAVFVLVTLAAGLAARRLRRDREVAPT